MQNWDRVLSYIFQNTGSSEEHKNNDFVPDCISRDFKIINWEEFLGVEKSCILQQQVSKLKMSTKILYG
jgi:hypothetical protein